MKNFNTDSSGDIFSDKYQQYIPDSTSLIDTLEQLENNFENAFGFEPSRKDMEQAITFIELFICEIGETCAKTIKAKAASEISYLIDSNDPIETSKRISEYRTDN